MKMHIYSTVIIFFLVFYMLFIDSGMFDMHIIRRLLTYFLRVVRYKLAIVGKLASRAVRYDDIYRMDEIKSLSFHIMFYHLYRGVTKYIVSGNTFSS